MLLHLMLWANLITSPSQEIQVKNSLDEARSEVVSIPVSKIEKTLGNGFDISKLELLDANSKAPVLMQWVDLNQDGKNDELLFWVEIAAKSTNSYQISLKDNPSLASTPVNKTYVKFVPERIDDIAWENDKVAFRTYGPEAQRITDAGEPGGTLTSGIDAWMKRVAYPIIDKWYQKYVDGGSYHKDSGEGYDPYHVGNSRGIGGVGIWMEDSLYVSKNFVSYSIISEGPLRAVFELTYAPWKAGEVAINETKRISLDLGSQLYHMEEQINASKKIPNITTAITLHEGAGKVNLNEKLGWYSYWETIDDADLGTGIVADPKHIISSEEFRTEKKEQSHLYIHLKPSETVSYYAGFGWQKAGDFSTQKEWNQYLENFASKIASPLVISIK